MKLFINGKEQDFTGQTLAEYMKLSGMAERKAAVAVNGGFVPKAGHADYTLKEGDELEILTPMQGG